VTDQILALSGALGLLGVAIYGALQIVKAGVPARLRKETGLGRAAMKAAPLVLGAALCAIPGVVSGLANIFGDLPELEASARVVLGLVAGATATTTHSIMRKRLSEALRAPQRDETASDNAP
jgi:hypothetical protein